MLKIKDKQEKENQALDIVGPVYIAPEKFETALSIWKRFKLFHTTLEKLLKQCFKRSHHRS